MTFVEQYEARPLVIRHFVFFSAQSSQLDVVFEGLKILEKIPYADLVEVRLKEKLDEISNKIDVVIYAEFSSDEALNAFNAFKSRPLYEESIERVLPNRELRFVAVTRS